MGKMRRSIVSIVCKKTIVATEKHRGLVREYRLTTRLGLGSTLGYRVQVDLVLRLEDESIFL